jgi:endonuclease YncB( thermonuclease family)
MKWLFVFIFSSSLLACGGGDGLTPVPFSAATYCGVITGTGRINGLVSSVHDGDTLTVNGRSVRLDSIDAPELNQAYGPASRDHLASFVLGQRVTVTYAKTDFYDRVVGTVFKPDCSNVNLNQVSYGAAWYYEAYKCEIDSRQRTAFAAAQTTARAGRRGLWAAPAIAPWVFRNGVEANIPTDCPNADSAFYPSVSLPN